MSRTSREREHQIKPKESRREIIKITEAEINKTEKQPTIEKIKQKPNFGTL